MPYRWTQSDAGAQLPPDTTELHLWPYRSLPRKGFVIFIAITLVMVSLPLLALLGTIEMWWVLAFIAMAVAGVWWALSHSYRTGEVLEVLSLSPRSLRLTRHDPGRKPARHWEANPHWVRVALDRSGGPVPDYLTLTGGPREVELGAFLTPEERRALYDELRRNLDLARAPIGMPR
ncbi:DUF2244 domain-containing protein [Thioclava sp. BHET1]|uniref:Integral membrane protein n=1 Tax=Thioclava dalianensis TaxID=1185766 RepID=A0A074TA08_9RHOB|nr:DUF2244 domain-containing protein [Thioclava dalianensis]KEP68641.1 hypothetical protein DL1_09545 [Thioclava dalianensis]TMV91345.1 DUF2244 domain-containing protein [Thioclava sp. BHET1]SFN04114.1 Uncharacterized membrane protein [Thioclava dalianensis]